MDQVKIGKFIAERRKIKKLTQKELAEKLNITDRAVSKWENGRGLPDSSIMIELCNILDITVNELLSGKEIDMKEYDKAVEENLLTLKNNQEVTTKKLYIGEVLLLISSTIFVALSIYLTSYDLPKVFKIFSILISVLFFIIVGIYSINLELTTGTYECTECHHKHIPNIIEFIVSQHVGWKRKIMCSTCKKKTWHKKIF